MDPRISFVTLAVTDLDASRRFYVDGLGWTADLDVPGEVIMVHAAEPRDWGGYTGYFGDPDGYRWEVAYNPGPIGQVVLP